MNYYTLEAVIKGKDVKFNKAFTTRKSAIDFALDYYEKQFVYGLEISEEIAVGDDKHNIEYVCGNNNRFRVKRVTL